MRSLYLCVVHRHDPALVALAAVICASGVYAAFGLAREVLRAPDAGSRLVWTLAAILTLAFAIWATHFVAMLAFMPGMPTSYALDTTLISLDVAATFVAVGVAVMLRWTGPVGRGAGGAIVGLAIVAMHYTGMAAWRLQGRMVWSADTVALSVLLGIGFAALSALLTLSARQALRRLAPPALLLAVCLAHFEAMDALAVVYDPRVAAPAPASHQALLTLVVANAAFAVLGLSMAAIWQSGRARGQRETETRRLHDMADIAVEGLLIADGGAIDGLNNSLETMVGIEREALIGQAVERLLPGIDAACVPDGREVDAGLSGVDGPIPVRIVAKRISAGGRWRTVIAVRDQRERLRAEAEMAWLAHYDTLTGLANRGRFNESLAARCDTRRRAEEAFALLLIDLDRFKLVNDTLGHAVGDELLRRVAGRLGNALRTEDFLARLGGDEFAILTNQAVGSADVRALAERITDVVARPFLIEDHVIEIGASVGIAFSPADGTAPEELSRHADLALYRAKEEGRGTYRFFEAEMNLRMQARHALEADLRRALARHELSVVYQPQVHARSGAYDGAEALVRWHHPQRGTVSPADFIPIAEEIGTIGALGDFVLRTACADALTWPDHLSVSVNLSPVQLRDASLAVSIRRILAETGLPGSRLELEITESALIGDEARTLDMLRALRAVGIRISMDDFGTGYSSLSYLRRFPFDKIKIDQSFVRQLPEDADSSAIVQAIASLGSKLGMTVTAEGVETPEQRRLVADEGCDQIQGYLISKPVSAEAIAAIFARAHPSTIAA